MCRMSPKKNWEQRVRNNKPRYCSTSLKACYSSSILFFTNSSWFDIWLASFLHGLYHVANCCQGTRIIKLADGKELSQGDCSCYHIGTTTASVEHHQRCLFVGISLPLSPLAGVLFSLPFFLFLRLSVSSMVQNVMDEFWCHFGNRQIMDHRWIA